MTPRRLRAPREDGAILADPPLDRWADLIAENRARLASWDHDFQGRRAGRLRCMARSRAFEAARAYHESHGIHLPAPAWDPDQPIVATGHQPELFHPGVWVKNFAVAALAGRVGGIGLNLIADNDTLKKASVRVPTPSGTAAVIPFDEWHELVPQEDQVVQDEAEFAAFGARVREALGDVVPDPLIDDYWPRAVRRGKEAPQVGLRLALARREIEEEWGIRNWEARLGAVADTDAFAWFVSHLLAHLPRFQAVHNDALVRYRKAYKIRSTHHPVAALREEGEWREAPFWIWRAEHPRRQPLFVRQRDPMTMELRMGNEEEPFVELPLGPEREACCAVERLLELPGRRIRLRTRALTTTMYSRLLLSDVFLHGIGGAKYDELGDEIIRGFYGVEAPAYTTLSLTLWLGMPSDPDAPARLGRLDRLARDLEYNPDRHLVPPVPAEAESLAGAKREAIAGPQETRKQRVARYYQIREYNAQLQGAVAGQVAELGRERAESLEAIERDSLARSREFSAVLHSRGRLQGAFAGVVGAINPPSGG